MVKSSVYILLASLFFTAGQTRAEDDLNHSEPVEKEKKLAIAPMVSSSPTIGTGLGINASYVYQADQNSHPSQLIFSGQYTTNDSYIMFLMNNASFRNDTVRSMTYVGRLSINNQFAADGNLSQDFIPNQDVDFNASTWLAGQRLVTEFADNWWVGGMFGLAVGEFDGRNTNGDIYLKETGIGQTTSSLVGLVLNYDSRDSHFYPTQGTVLDIMPSASLKALGSDYNSKQMRLDSRHYRTVNHNDVLAMQLTANLVENGAPPSAQSYLGRYDVLRAFNAGEYFGERLAAAQAEYRHTFTDKWKFVGFGGVAQLGGPTARALDNDKTYSSVGVGVRYLLQPQAGIHFRTDFAVGNDGSTGFYVGISEAF